MSKIEIHIMRGTPKPEVRPTRQNALLLWVIAAAGLLLSSLLSQLLMPALQQLNPYLHLLIANAVYYLPFAALPVFLLAKRRAKLYEAYRPNPISLFDVICIVILAVLGVFLVNDITVLWAIPFQKLGFNVFNSSLPAASTTGELMMSVLIVAVIPGICEEFLFRGAILSAFEEQGTKRAVYTSALLFMLIHGSLLGMPTQLILGVILACLVIWTDSIYAGLIYHTVHNATAVMLEFMQNRSMPAEAAAQTQDLYSAIGGTPGMLSLLLSILISGVMIFASLRMFRVRALLKGITAEKGQKNPLQTKEWLLVIAGGLLCALLYFIDTAAMLGG